MEESENKDRGEIFSRSVRAGKRTYFFDVKATIANEFYLTITESKRKFNNEQGKFFYEKHKLFLYKEDFDKFATGLAETIEFIRTGKVPPPELDEEKEAALIDSDIMRKHTEIEFEDLSSDTETN
ncbi:MAG TPA: DUF3276 family protein [Bacteroidales bacterium]|nr:DUF3276 family protein [Bacteroidales bacterium]HPS73394.1 DUF3276 family protein [Bacteroidales bacterium]